MNLTFKSLITFVGILVSIAFTATGYAAQTCVVPGVDCVCDGPLVGTPPGSTSCASHDMAGVNNKLYSTGFSEVGGGIGVPGPVAATGQTACYDAGGILLTSCSTTGQDGDKLAGVAWPTTRFTDNGNSTVTDKLTGLIWSQNARTPGPITCSPATVKYWQDALDYIACLNTNNYLNFTDWRLPNVNELESLINQGQTNSATWLGTVGFTTVQPIYWASTTSAYMSSSAWAVNLRSNLVVINDKGLTPLSVWPVRGGQTPAGQSPAPAPPALTGQTTCYDVDGNSKTCALTGQDAALFMGAVPPSPRFSVVPDTSVQDSLTNLYWAGDGSTPGPTACTPGSTKNWLGALEYVKCLNTNSYLGYTDWRLPNVKELRTLINYGQAANAIWLNGGSFTNVQAGAYWSSTSGNTGTVGSPASNALSVNLDTGEIISSAKGTLNYVIPVRGGQVNPQSSPVVVASNMYPYVNFSIMAELPDWIARADQNLTAGTTWRSNNLTLVGLTVPQTDTGTLSAREKLLFYPAENYETVGLVSVTDSDSDNIPDNCALSDINLEKQLIEARDTYAYQYFLSPDLSIDKDNAKAKVNQTVKTLANIFLMVADEFLIDALELRFSANILTAGVDAKLNDQVTKLYKAQACYDKAVKTLTYGYGQAVWTDNYLSEIYDPSIFTLFGIALERSSTAARERSAKQYAQSILPDPQSPSTSGIDYARAKAMVTVRSNAIRGYLVAAATGAQKQGEFSTHGGDRIVLALEGLRKQANIYRQNLNPLGFDDRYIPMIPALNLYNIAMKYKGDADQAQTNLNTFKRDFDANTTQYISYITKYIYDSSAGSGLKSQLSDMTGADLALNDIDFLKRASEAGYDLVDRCSTELSDQAFDACINDPAGKTGGRLKIKYNQIKAVQLNYERAVQAYENFNIKMDDTVAYYERQNQNVSVRFNSQVSTLKDFQSSMKKAMKDEYDRKNSGLFNDIKKGLSCVASVAALAAATVGTGGTATVALVAAKTAMEATEAAGAVAEGALGVLGCAGPSYDDEFAFEEKKLQLEIKKEVGLLEATKNFEISTNDNNKDREIKTLMTDQVLALIDKRAAQHQLKMAVQDYAYELKNKNNLIMQYAKAIEFRTYDTVKLQDNIVEARIMQSQHALNLAEYMRKGVHYAYLTAKAIEYIELKPIANIDDLYKAQNPDDLNLFLGSLYGRLTAQDCAYGAVSGQPVTYSLAQHVLGITPDLLNTKFGTATDSATLAAKSKYQFEQVQAFISQRLNTATNSLNYTFSTTVYNAPMTNPTTKTYMPNMKIWNGVPDYCTLPNQNFTPRGLSIEVKSKQSSSFEPFFNLIQKGTSTYLTKDQKVVEYVPVSKFFNIDFDLNPPSGALSSYLDPKKINDKDYDPTRTEGSFQMFYNNPAPTTYWTNRFQNRSIASSEWELTVFDHSNPYNINSKIDWSKVTDIVISVDAITFD